MHRLLKILWSAKDFLYERLFLCAFVHWKGPQYPYDMNSSFSMIYKKKNISRKKISNIYFIIAYYTNLTDIDYINIYILSFKTTYISPFFKYQFYWWFKEYSIFCWIWIYLINSPKFLLNPNKKHYVNLIQTKFS